jgi:hypothetical protein
MINDFKYTINNLVPTTAEVQKIGNRSSRSRKRSRAAITSFRLIIYQLCPTDRLLKITRFLIISEVWLRLRAGSM